MPKQPFSICLLGGEDLRSRSCDLEMDPSDLNTHLPPRKRLLAGLRTAASAFDADPPPSPSASADLAARLRAMASSTPEEMINAARAAAAAAADAAAAARATANEKAAFAAKARAAARAAMEFLDSFSRTGTGSSRNGLQLKVRSRKKHVQVKLLYKPPNGRVEGGGAVSPKPRWRRESDEDIALTLHHTTSVPLCKHEVPDNGGQDSSRYNTAKSSDITDNGVGIGNLSATRKVKLKRQELLLNQNNTSEETEQSPHSIAPDVSKSNGNGIEKCPSPADAKANSLAQMKITSQWKSKKFKASHCSSDSKVLRNVGSSPSAAETSVSVKTD